jgi:hypothetical protein
MANKIEPVCKNCRLYNPSEGLCQVVVLWEGRRSHIPVDPGDHCFFENEFVAVGHSGERETFVPSEEIKQVRFWVEDPKTGEKTSGDGVVKMEYPEGFFGDERRGGGN